MDWLQERGLGMGAGAGVSVVGGGQSRTMGERRKLSQQWLWEGSGELQGRPADLFPHPCCWVPALLADRGSGF